MAQSKEDLIKLGKEYGLNLKKTMSMYELKARIKEYEEAHPKETKEMKKSKSRDTGEY